MLVGRQEGIWPVISILPQQNQQEAQLLLRDRATRKPAKDCWNSMHHWNDLQMSFRVIKSGTNRKLVYDFLLVVYSHFCRLREIWCLMTLKYRQFHRQSYHLKAVVWCRIGNFSFCGRIVNNLWDTGRGNDNIGWKLMIFKCHSTSPNVVLIESAYMSCN